MKYTHLFTVLCLLLSANLTFAQGDYAPDRPGIGNGSSITPTNMLGLELGAQFSTNDFAQQFDIGQILLRYGLMDRLELRAALNSFSIQERSLIGGTKNVTGIQDAAVGFKYNVFHHPQNEANISLLGSLSLPTGSDDFTSNELVPFLSALSDFVLSNEMSLSSNVGYNFGYDSYTDFFLLTITPTFTLPKAKHSSFYAGYAGRFFGNDINQQFLEAGFTYSLVNAVQLDANMGFELKGETAFIGIGFAKGF